MVSIGLIDFGYTGAPQSNTYFNLPNYSLPYGDSSFSYVSRIGNYTSATLAVLVGGGVATNGAGMHIDINHSSVGKVGVDLYNYGIINIGTFSTNSVITCKYTSGNPANGINISIDKTQAGTGTAGLIRTQDYGYNAIGTSLAPGTNWSNQNPLNSQVYNLYNFSSVLTGPGANTDQSIVESTPYQYSAPAAITGLAASSVTATTFALAWNAYSGAASYTIFVNGAQNTTTTSTSLTVTPTGGGPWAVSVYAYNASNVLLASNYVSVSPGTLFNTFYLLFGFTATYGLDNTTNGGAVTKWTDQRMGVTITGSGTYNSNILNGLPMMSSLLLTFPSSFLSTAPFLGNFSMFFVFNTGNTSSGNSDLLVGSSLFISIQSSYLSIGMQNVGYAPQPTAALSNNTNYIFTILSSCAGGSNPMVITYRINGVDKTPGSNTWAQQPLMQTLRLQSGQCSIGEFIMYGTNLGVSVAQTVEQYLSKKWQIPIGTTPTIAATSPYIN
jgi:hypothetical protein